jgi:predicted DNA-binding protein with PD1-like motif
MGLTTYRRTGMSSLIAVALVIWLAIGALAAAQRHYFTNSAKESCATAGTITVTILAGPLNYVGANPKVHCHVPQPSK